MFQSVEILIVVFCDNGYLVLNGLLSHLPGLPLMPNWAASKHIKKTECPHTTELWKAPQSHMMAFLLVPTVKANYPISLSFETACFDMWELHNSQLKCDNYENPNDEND